MCRKIMPSTGYLMTSKGIGLNFRTKSHRNVKRLVNIPLQKQKIATRERQGYLSESEADLQFRATREDEARHQAEINKLEMMLENGNLAQVKELIERVNWLHREYNFGDFSDVPDTEKRQ